MHAGHIALIRTVLDEGKPVLIALRNTALSPDDPYTIAERADMFRQEFGKEIVAGRLRVICIPNIAEVCYGRKVGWGIRQIRLDGKTERISGTKIRKGMT